jgi:hypothetical protein
MDADEKAICEYLKSWPGQFVSGREVSRRAGGKWRFRDDPEWAGPILARLVEKALIESDATGHYRLVPPPKSKRDRKWVSPHIRRILEKSGKDFSNVLGQEEPEDLDKDT